MTRSQTGVALLLLCLPLCLPTLAEAQPAAVPPLPRLAIEGDSDAVVVRAIEGAARVPFPISVRLRTRAGEDSDDLDRRLAPLAQLHVPIWLTVAAPSRLEDVPAFRQWLQRLLDRRGASLIAVDLEIDLQPVDLARFVVQTAATDVRASGASARMAISGPGIADPARRRSIYTRELAPYVDLLLVPGDDVGDVEADVRAVDTHVSLVLRSTRDSGEPVGRLLADLGTAVAVRIERADELSADVLNRLAPLSTLMTDPVSTIDEAGVALHLLDDSTDVTSAVSHRLLIDTETLRRYFWYLDAGQVQRSLQLRATLSVDAPPTAIDLRTGRRLATLAYQYDRATNLLQVTLPQTGGPVLVEFDGEGVAISERSGVSAERPLLVAEIVARHQQQQRAQDAQLQSYVAHARMEQHFRPNVADPGYDVVAENTYFVAADGVEWEELSFAVNGSKWGADRPPFPLLQPEKVLALPLQLRFDEGYRYRLEGTEKIDGFDCYVVKFDPLRADSALSRGTVWIDRRSFASIRIQAVQSGLSAPVVSNEEIQRFAPVPISPGLPPLFLFTELTAHQIVLVAGRNLLVDKRVLFSEFQINHADFSERRASARRSEHVMYRETERGLRNFVKDGDQRVVSDRQALGVRALAMGVTVDPSYSFPLPILGINYLDFQFGDPDTQLAILFAGVLAAGNVQRSRVLGPRVDASIDFFAIAVPSTDRLFGVDGDDPTTRLLTWPLSTGLNVGWQATPYQRATFQYQFRFDGYVRDRTTRESFAPPASTVTNGIGGAWEYRRAGYSLVSNGALFERAGWKPWGDGATTPGSYIKYNVTLSRDIYLGLFQKLHFNGGWFSGRDLDRFGKYQFGMFDDTRIHGVPGSGVRYGDLAVARGSYSLNIFEQYRLDLFLEHGWGRDEVGRGSWERIPALGFALNVKAPWNTILRADVGKSFLPPRYQHLGSATLQIMLLKPLR